MPLWALRRRDNAPIADPQDADTMSTIPAYPATQLLIDGQWCDAADGRTLAVVNPATGAEIGRVAHAGTADLDRALAAAQKGFATWRAMPAAERAKWRGRVDEGTRRQHRGHDDAGARQAAR
jgi:delta 1-pyrroline-5-carboxylate dehydrogenase